jgi:hypothetical protein
MDASVFSRIMRGAACRLSVKRRRGRILAPAEWTLSGLASRALVPRHPARSLGDDSIIAAAAAFLRKIAAILTLSCAFIPLHFLPEKNHGLQRVIFA